MKFRKLAKALAVVLTTTPLTLAVAHAYELVIPGLMYRTGPYAPNGIPFANGFADYLNLLNERDGGIEGLKIKYTECETGYNTKRGVECYESVKGTAPSGALAIQPLSTGITYQLIPKASKDKIPVFSMGYGRTSAANGKIFPWQYSRSFYLSITSPNALIMYSTPSWSFRSAIRITNLCLSTMARPTRRPIGLTI